MKKFWWYATVVLGVTISSACQENSEGETDKLCRDHSGAARDLCLNMGGEGGTTLHLPFAAGRTHRCVQGVDGEYSHQLTTTRFDLDLDTDNWSDEVVYAPADGTAYVHEEDPAANFGRHVNIDLGDGTYAVIAHLKAIFVKDRHPVAAGQLLGFEGTTGHSTGDHVHLGVHAGKADEPAERGESIPANYLVRQGELGADPISLKTEQFVCDLQSGESYESELPVPCSHPNGTLIKTPYDSKVFRLDEGRTRWITDQEIFWSYGYEFGAVVLVDQAEMGGYAAGPDINQPGGVAAAYDADGQLWLLVAPRTRPDRYRIKVGATDWREVLASWGLIYTQGEAPLPYDSTVAAQLVDWPERAGSATLRDGTLFRTVSDSAVYVVTQGWPAPIESWATFLRLGYDYNRILFLADGAVERLFGRSGGCESAGLGCVREQNILACGPMDLGAPAETGGILTAIDEPADAGVMVPDATVADIVQGDQAKPDAMVVIRDAGTIRPDATEPDQTVPDTATAQDIYQPEIEMRTLRIVWFTPFSAPADRITLSGEYKFADGSFGFFWHELKTVHDAASIDYEIAGVESEDTFRFSVEYEAADGQVSWSCIGPFVAGTSQQGTLQGRVMAQVDNMEILVQKVGDPTGQTTGCGLSTRIP